MFYISEYYFARKNPKTLKSLDDRRESAGKKTIIYKR